MTASDGRWDVIGIGENSVDSVSILPGIRSRPVRPRRCGSASVIFCAAARWRRRCARAPASVLRAKYVGVTGTDDNGRRIRAELQGRNVDISDLVIRDVENRFAVILVDENTGDRMVLWDRDDRPAPCASRSCRSTRSAAPKVVPRRRRRRRGRRPGGKAGARGRGDGDERHRSADAAHRGAGRDGDARHLRAARPDDAHRARRHRSGPAQAAQDARQRAGRDDGRARRVGADGDRFYHEPCVHGASRSTRPGAGDVFRGGFIYALVNGQPMGQALRTANAAAAVSCTRLGALNGVPTLAEVDELMLADVRR
jgi:sugar/nucleoside kinase (ribokinase family)